MLTTEHVAAIAAEEGLADHADALVARVQPGWRLKPATQPSGLTRLGGDPDLAPGEMWPLNHRGVPLTFLAQVDCSALPAIDPAWAGRVAWRHEGQLVRLFADLVDSPFEPGVAAALACPPNAAVARTRQPAVSPDRLSEGLDDEDRVWCLEEHPLAPVPFLTVPETHPGLRDDLFDDEPVAELYERFSTRVRGDGRPADDERSRPWEAHHLLGEPSSIQDEVQSTGAFFHGGGDDWLPPGTPPDPALASADAWAVLLALHDDQAHGLHILDGGAIHVLAPKTDLALGRLDRLVCAVDSC